MSGTHVDGRVRRGEMTRHTILERAADIASVEGLAGLSIGRLATELGVSKSGVFAHFGAKEELQLATVRAASDVVRREVVDPTLEVPPGLDRVWRMYGAFLDYSSRRVFSGGCFFFAATAEFDARPGRVRDALADARSEWLRFQQRTIEDARQLGRLVETVDAQQLAFELDAFAIAANSESLLHGGTAPYERARTAILTRLYALAVDSSTLPHAPG